MLALCLFALLGASAGASNQPSALGPEIRDAKAVSTTQSSGILLVSTSPTVADPLTCQCHALWEVGLGDRLLFPTDAGYEPQIATWYARNARLRPYCLVMPRNTQEVSTALTTLVNVNKGAGDWHMGVRNGGHGWRGSNNVANGVTIDPSMIHSTADDSETNLDRIQPDGRWRDVFADLQRDGVAVAGGRDGDVGVGGCLLGGRLSFFAGRLGFGCDPVVNFADMDPAAADNSLVALFNHDASVSPEMVVGGLHVKAGGKWGRVELHKDFVGKLTQLMSPEKFRALMIIQPVPSSRRSAAGGEAICLGSTLLPAL